MQNIKALTNKLACVEWPQKLSVIKQENNTSLIHITFKTNDLHQMLRHSHRKNNN